MTFPTAGPIDLPNPFADAGRYLVGHLVDALRGLLRELSADFLGQVAAPLARYALHTPDLAAEPTLRQYWLTSLGVLGACAGLLCAVAGLALIPGGSSRLAVAARETLGVRLVGGLLTAGVSLPLITLEIGLANRIVDAFLGAAPPGRPDPVSATLGRALHGDLGAGLALLVVATVGVVLLVALLVLGLLRWATVWLLVVLAPIAMGLAVLPGGAGVARLWWRLQLTTVLLPVANAVLLGTYVAMFASDRSGLVGALSGVAVLALMIKLPAWAAGAAVGSATGPQIGDVTSRAYRVHRAARHLNPVSR